MLKKENANLGREEKMLCVCLCGWRAGFVRSWKALGECCRGYVSRECLSKGASGGGEVRTYTTAFALA
jgi:hypothetical protein